MHKIAILTDSTSDLSLEFMNDHDIYSIPHYVRFDYEIYQDGINLISDDLYHLIKEKKQMPRTSPATHEDFIAFFERFLGFGYDVLYIGIGSKFSTAMQNVNLAREATDPSRIYIVDSDNISSGIGILVLKALELKNKKYSIKNIHETLSKLTPKVRNVFALRTTKYIVKGGHLGQTFRWIERLIGLKPMIQVKDGDMEMFKHPFGSMRHAMKIMLKALYEQKDFLSFDTVMITHSLANRQALYMIAQIKKHIPSVEIMESKAGCVISSHCGSGAIGLTYMIK